MIIEDFERESQKDFVYLLEKMMFEEREYREWCISANRKPAKVEIINESKLKEIHEQTCNPEVLPF